MRTRISILCYFQDYDGRQCTIRAVIIVLTEMLLSYPTGEQGNFGKMNSKNLGLPYDYSSVMHYGA